MVVGMAPWHVGRYRAITIITDVIFIIISKRHGHDARALPA